MQERVTTFGYKLLAQDGAARLGEMTTPRGLIRTPAFMPVGTVGTVKALYFDQVKAAGADIVLANTYHLMLRPGAERVARLGGLHAFMRWDGPILTDSGGFQVMSLSKIRKVSEEGVRFQSHIDGSRHMLTPERAVDIQCLLDADIQMQLDECIELPAEHKEAERAMELSLRWAERARNRLRDARRSGTSAVRHRAGRHRRRAAPPLGRSAGRPWTFPATRSAASPSARARISCWRRSRACCRSSPRTSRAT